MSHQFLLVALSLFAATAVLALDNGLARTPPMGWLSWEKYACNTDCATYPDSCINDKLYMAMADAMATDDWVAAGYEYINIDDCWPAYSRDAQNNIVADPVRFPNGIEAVCDYVHKRGLKCGLYTDIGTETCGGYPGLNTAGNISQTTEDLKRFLAWGIDSLKVDGCNADPATMPTTYPAVSKLLMTLPSQRPVLYSCSWPAYISSNMTDAVYQSLHDNCNLWRNWNDISDSWESVKSIVGWWNSNGAQMSKFAGPGAWNDPDMILVGNTGLSQTQQQVQMGMWAMFAAPLLMSNDLRTIDPAAKAILQTLEVIDINQDPAGHQAVCVDGCSGEQQLWVRQLTARKAARKAAKAGLTPSPLPSSSWRYAIALLNLHAGVPGYPVAMSFSASQLGLPADTTFNVRDVWAAKDLGSFQGTFSARVPCNAMMLLVVTPSNVHVS